MAPQTRRTSFPNVVIERDTDSEESSSSEEIGEDDESEEASESESEQEGGEEVVESNKLKGKDEEAHLRRFYKTPIAKFSTFREYLS